MHPGSVLETSVILQERTLQRRMFHFQRTQH